MLRTPRYHCARALSFWNSRNRHAQLHHATAHTGIARSCHPFLAVRATAPVRRACQPSVARDRPAIAHVPQQQLVHKQVGGLDADTGDACQQAHHGMWLSVGCPLQTFKTVLLDAPDLIADEAPALHDSLELGQSVGRDMLALGCAQRLEPLLRMSQLRIEAPDPEPDQCCLHTIDEPALLTNQALALPARSLSVLLPKAWNGSRLAVITARPAASPQ